MLYLTCFMWLIMDFMSYLIVVIIPCPYIAFTSLVIVYFSNYHFLTIYSLLCPCPCRKIGYCQKLIDRYDIHSIQVALWGCSAFTPHSTLAESIKGFIVLISTCFTSLSLITKKVNCLTVAVLHVFRSVSTHALTTSCYMCLLLLFATRHGW